MVTPHGWRECRPGVLNLRSPLLSGSAIMRVVEEVWALMPDPDRQLFHQFTCFNRHGNEQIAVMNRFAEQLRERRITSAD
jgi:hypothetical protein